MAQTIGHGASSTPHPAVVRIVAPEVDGTAYGSGTLIDVRKDYGLVLTNWHVVCGATGPIEVVFPSGFVSQARALKMDSDWDLAALVIWRPPCEPVKLSSHPPRPGDSLTICGYGSGNYRAVTGRCTQYYAPRLELPQELVELDVQARQGDSGGPIFNSRGELAGVLFGAGQGTTLGSFEGRVKTFLASLAPDIGQRDSAPQVALRPESLQANCPSCQNCPPFPRRTPDTVCEGGICRPSSDLGDVCFGCDQVAQRGDSSHADDWPELKPKAPQQHDWTSGEDAPPTKPQWPQFDSETTPITQPIPPRSASHPMVSNSLFENIRNGLAIVGALAIVWQALRIVG